MITYNHERFIHEGIEGVIKQVANFDIELVISNDCSTDNTHQLIQKVISKNTNKRIRIKYFNQKKNLGVMPNFLFTLRNCSGKYIAMCEGDDYWTEPLKLQKQVDFLEDHLNIGACFTNATIHDHIAEQKREYNQAHGLKEGIVSNELIYHIGGSIYPTCTLVFRRDLLEHIDLNTLGIAGDEQLIFGIANISKIFYLDFISGVYNRWQGGAFSGIKDDKKKLLTYRKGEIKGYRKFGKQLTPENKALLNKKKITAIDYVLQNSSGILPILKYAPDNGIKKTLQLLRKKWRNHYSRS